MRRFISIVMLGICLSLPVSAANNELAQVYQNVVESFNHKKYSLAEELIKNYLASAASSDRRIPEMVFLLAKAYDAQGEFAQATDYYQMFIRSYPDHGKIVDVLLALGKSYYLRKEYSNGQAVFQKIYLEYPTTYQAVEAMKMESLCLIEQKDLVAAKEVISRLANKYPRHQLAEESLYTLGQAWLNIGAYAQSRETFKRLLALNPSDENAAAAYYGLGWASYREGTAQDDLREVFEGLEQVVEKYPDTSYAPESLFLMAKIGEEYGLFKVVSQKYQLLIDFYHGNPKRTEAMFALAQNYRKMGLNADSLSVLKSLIEECPESKFTANAYFLIGENAQREKDYSQAIEAYIHIINQASNFRENEKGASWKPFFQLASGNFLVCVKQLNDKDFLVDSYFLLAEASSRLQDYNSSLQYYVLIAKTLDVDDERYLKAREGQAAIYLRKKDGKQARRIYETLLENISDPSVIIRLTTLIAQTYYHQGENVYAIRILTELIEKYPERLETSFANYWLGEIYYRQGRYKEAIANYSASLNIKGNQEVVSPEVLYKLAYCHYLLNDMVECLKVAERLLDDFPQAVETRAASFLVANVYYKLQNYYLSLTYYRKIVKIFPDSPIAPIAQFRVASILFLDQKYLESSLEFNQFLVSFSDHELKNKVQFALGLSFFLNEDWQSARMALLECLKENNNDDLREEVYYLLFLEAQKSADFSLAKEYLTKMEIQFPQSPYQFEVKITQADYQMDDSLRILHELDDKKYTSEAATIFLDTSKEVERVLEPYSEMMKVTVDQLKTKHLVHLKKLVIDTPLNEDEHF